MDSYCNFPAGSGLIRLRPFEDEPVLAAVFRDYQEWLEIIGVAGVADLNDAISNGRARDIILIAEALHSRQLSEIGTMITSRPSIRVVLISGPTSAGKTTFSKRLAIQLLAHGIFPVTIGWITTSSIGMKPLVMKKAILISSPSRP